MHKNNKIIKIQKIAYISIFILLLAVFLLPNFVSADEVNVGLEYGEQIGLGSNDPRIVIAKIVRVALGFLGILAVSLIMYAGWIWMSSEGNEEDVNRAKSILKNAIIGLIIVLSAFSIVSFILNKMLESTGSGGLGPGGGPGGGGIAALGNSIIEAHYPARNQEDVPRNTKIVITFKEAIDETTVMSDENINDEYIKIYMTVNGIDSFLLSQDVLAYKSDDNKTFVFMPEQYLGSPSEKIWYTVALSSNIKKENGDEAFHGVLGEVGYSWMFEVGTYIDLIPPQVKSIIPLPSVTEPRNVVIQINFNEAVDPLSSSGSVSDGFDNIIVNNITDATQVPGNFYISNQYKTVEFLTEDACGINSCGEIIFCLPGDKDLSTLIKASTLFSLSEPTAIFPYDGVVDMASNSFDGNKNGQSQGGELQSGLEPYNANNPSLENVGDDYIWSFSTNDEINISAPEISSLSPDIMSNGVDLDIIPEIVFNKVLMSRSLNSNSVVLFNNNTINFWIRKSNDIPNSTTIIYINHDQFYDDFDYSIEINSEVRDIYQNCYSPCSSNECSGGPSCCEGYPSGDSQCFN